MCAVRECGVGLRVKRTHRIKWMELIQIVQQQHTPSLHAGFYSRSDLTRGRFKRRRIFRNGQPRVLGSKPELVTQAWRKLPGLCRLGTCQHRLHIWEGDSRGVFRFTWNKGRGSDWSVCIDSKLRSPHTCFSRFHFQPTVAVTFTYSVSSYATSVSGRKLARDLEQAPTKNRPVSVIGFRLDLGVAASTRRHFPMGDAPEKSKKEMTNTASRSSMIHGIPIRMESDSSIDPETALEYTGQIV